MAPSSHITRLLLYKVHTKQKINDKINKLYNQFLVVKSEKCANVKEHYTFKRSLVKDSKYDRYSNQTLLSIS